MKEERALLKQPDGERIVAILRAAVRSLYENRTGRFHAPNISEAMVARAVYKRSRMVLAAADVSPSKVRMAANVDGLMKEARALIAVELRDARGKLKRLRQEIASAEQSLRAASQALASITTYPPVPLASLGVTKFGDGLPEVPGIYFVWHGGLVHYVGQSTNLKNRCRILGHHAIIATDRLSWLEFPKASLNFAESFYIGTLFPPRNFGKLSATYDL